MSACLHYDQRARRACALLALLSSNLSGVALQVLQLEYQQSQTPLVVAIGAALVVHGLFFVFALPQLLKADPQDAPQEKAAKAPEEMRVTVRSMPRPEPEPREKEEEPEPKPAEPEPVEPEPEVKVAEVIPIDRKVVEQVTNAQRPTEAQFVSDKDNKTARETRAKETTMKEVLPSDTPTPELEDTGSPDPDVERDSKDEDPAQASEALAMAVKQPTSSPRDERERARDTPEQKTQPSEARPPEEDGQLKPDEQTESPVIKQKPTDGPRAKVDPKRLFGPPSVSDYERVFGKEAPTPKSAGDGKKRRRLFANHAEKQRALKGSLENMIPEIQPGNHTSVNAHRSVYVGYINALHRRIHARWAGRFLIMLDTQYPRSHPMQDPTLGVTLEFVIDAKTGEFEEVTVVQTSGQLQFDAEAITTAWAIGPRPNPPPQIVSQNGKIYVHWTFWRDGRQCGVFGASIYLMLKDKDGNTFRSQTDMPE